MARTAINKLIKKMSGESYKTGLRIVDGHIVLKESTQRLENK